MTRAKLGPLQATKERPFAVNQPQRQHAGAAKPTAPASRLIADALLDDGSPLELGVVATGREPTEVATPKVAKLRVGSQDGGELKGLGVSEACTL